MSYNPNLMPTNIDEWNALIDYFTGKSATEHAEAVAAATAQAEAAYASLPDDEHKPTLADYIAQAISGVPPAEPREYFEKMYACYYPQPVEAEPAPTFEELKAARLAELGAAFYTACQTATVATPAGWIADADETANRNVAGLITTLEAAPKAETVQFCDHANQFHEVTLADLKAIQLLIIEHGQQLYGLKWQYRNAIESAQSEADLDAIAISF